MTEITVGTRGSPLALAQAKIVETLLKSADPHLRVRTKPIRTEGDELSDNDSRRSLSGKAVFTGRIETALRDGTIDIAIHSLKDLPTETNAGIVLAAIPPREDPLDVWISRDATPFANLSPRATVATSSLRRAAQLRSRHPGITITPLQGNVGTRLRKLEESDWDGVVLAAAGVRRLGLAERVTDTLPPEVVLPAPGQGALAVQARANDSDIVARLETIDDPATRAAVDAERAFAQVLGGDCNVPLAALGTVAGSRLRLLGRVLDPGGGRLVEAAMSGDVGDAWGVGQRLAQELERQGARLILSAVAR